MAADINNKPIGTKPVAAADEAAVPVPDKIVIPDECGDSLWDEVLNQQPTLTEQLSPKQAVEGAQAPNNKAEQGGATK